MAAVSFRALETSFDVKKVIRGAAFDIVGGEKVTLVTHNRNGGRPGNRVAIAIETDGVHLFDDATGVRLN